MVINVHFAGKLIKLAFFQSANSSERGLQTRQHVDYYSQQSQQREGISEESIIYSQTQLKATFNLVQIYLHISRLPQQADFYKVLYA